MSFAQLLNFNGPSGFNVSNVTISGSGAKLSLIDNPEQVFSQDFSSSSGFTFNSSLAEFTGGLVRQKDQRETGSVIGATYTSSKSLNWSNDGSLTSTDIGTPVLSGGKIQCRGGNHGLRYDNAAIGSVAGSLAIKAKVTPQYSGTPATDCCLFELANPSSNNDRIVFHHRTTGGTVAATVYNSSGSIVQNVQAMGSAWSPVSGTTYEMLFVVEASTGIVRLFIDGALKGSTSSATTFTRGTSATRLYVGAGTLIINANADFDDVVLFNETHHLSVYTAGYTVPELIYSASKVDGPAFSYTGVGTIQSVDDGSVVEVGSPRYIFAGFYWDGSDWVFSNGSYSQANDFATILLHLDEFVASGGTLPWSIVFTDSNTQSSVNSFSIEVTGQKYTLDGYVENIQAVEASSLISYEDERTTPTDTNIKIILSDDGVLKYHNGTSWVNSNGTYAQSNTVAELAANIASLDLGENSLVYMRWVFNTTDIQASPTLESATLTYEFGAIENIPDLVLVYGYVRDIAGAPISGATVAISLSQNSDEYIEASENIILNGGITVATNSDGYFSTNLIRTSELPDGLEYVVTINKGDTLLSKDNGSSISFTIPDVIETLDITSRLPG